MKKETASARSLNSLIFFSRHTLQLRLNLLRFTSTSPPAEILICSGTREPPLCSRVPEKEETRDKREEEEEEKEEEEKGSTSRNGSQRATEVRNDACSPTGGTDVQTRIFHAKWKMKEKTRNRERERNSPLVLQVSTEFGRVRKSSLKGKSSATGLERKRGITRAELRG